MLKFHDPIQSSHIISAVSYYSGQAKSLIHFMKENNDPYVFDYAAGLILEKLQKTDLSDKLSDYYITYAPRNPITRFRRRFDQSGEIADFLAYGLFGDDGSRVISFFRRKIIKTEQKKLGAVDRTHNAKNIFSINKRVMIPDKLIIVDDITTTGSTLLVLRDIALGVGVRECLLCTVAVNDGNRI